jgi:hypothetical protein
MEAKIPLVNGRHAVLLSALTAANIPHFFLFLST